MFIKAVVSLNDLISLLDNINKVIVSLDNYRLL